MMMLEAVLVFSICTPYVIYAWAYRYTASYLKYLTPENFEDIGIIFKVVSTVLQGITALMAGVNWSGFILMLPVFILGQLLNAAVYKRLGKLGTYYGFEFGLIKGEILTGFPFSLEHAQYKGSLLSAIAVFFAFNPTHVTLIAVIAWIISYTFIIFVESGPSERMMKVQKSRTE